MKVTQLHVDGQCYYLPANFDTRALQQEFLAAASGAPAFITFHPAADTEITVLVTGHTSVRFAVSERSDTDEFDVDDIVPDIDQYGFLDAA